MQEEKLLGLDEMPSARAVPRQRKFLRLQVLEETSGEETSKATLGEKKEPSFNWKENSFNRHESFSSG